MVPIEENHELLDIILGYKPDRYAANTVEVEFVNTIGVDMEFTLISPNGTKFHDIKTYTISDVGMWSYKAFADGYDTQRGHLLVTKSIFGEHIVIELNLNREGGDVLVSGEVNTYSVSGVGSSVTPIPNMKINHYIYSGTYRSSGNKTVNIGKYSYYNNYETFYYNYYNYTGYRPLTYYYKTYTADEQSLQTVYLISNSLSGPGYGYITIRDITTGGSVYGNIYVEAYDNWGAQDRKDIEPVVKRSWDLGTVGTETINLDLNTGYYTIKVWGDYYKETYANIYVLPEPYSSDTEVVYLTPELKADGLKAVLTWGVNPSDLDSHIRGWLDGSEVFHVYYSNKDYTVGGTVHVNLDVDDTSSYGPETTSIYYRDAGFKYYYYIFCFNSHTYGIPADAQVAIYSDGRLLFTVRPQTDRTGSSSYLYWKVFSYDGDTQRISIKNQIVSNEPNEYNWESDN